MLYDRIIKCIMQHTEHICTQKSEERNTLATERRSPLRVLGDVRAEASLKAQPQLTRCFRAWATCTALDKVQKQLKQLVKKECLERDETRLAALNEEYRKGNTAECWKLARLLAGAR